MSLMSLQVWYPSATAWLTNTETRYLLHVVDELAGVVSVGYGVADEYGNGYHGKEMKIIAIFAEVYSKALLTQWNRK